MRILHCCLANFYVDDASYQENILTKMHKHQGHEVEILASTETFVDRTELGYVTAGSYENEYGIPVTRLPYVKWIPHAIVLKIRVYKGVFESLERFKPDVIFIHGPQFYNVSSIVRYVGMNPSVDVYADSHTDFINSGRNFLSKFLQHKLLYRWYVNRIEPVCKIFFGVLPLRVDFLIDVYKVPENKVQLLEMGADDLVLQSKDRLLVRKRIRNELGLCDDDILLFTGGKIRPSKKIVELIEAVNLIGQGNVYLCVAGTPLAAFATEYKERTKNLNFFELGWQSNDSMYDYLIAADLAVFPGTHSVLWEQAVGVGLPCLFRRIEGITHLDIGGNCLFVSDTSVNGLFEALSKLLEDVSTLPRLKAAALAAGRRKFLYSTIAEKAISL